MSRKCCGTVLVLLAIISMAAADSISYNPGQPNPNPGGAANKLEANGTYALAPGNDLNAVSFIADDGIGIVTAASAKDGAWSVEPMTINKGTYKCTAQLTVNDGQKIWLSKQVSVEGVVVK